MHRTAPTAVAGALSHPDAPVEDAAWSLDPTTSATNGHDETPTSTPTVTSTSTSTPTSTQTETPTPTPTEPTDR